MVIIGITIVTKTLATSMASDRISYRQPAVQLVTPLAGHGSAAGQSGRGGRFGFCIHSLLALVQELARSCTHAYSCMWGLAMLIDCSRKP